MILGKPTLGAVLDLIEAEGCPFCGQLPREISVDDPVLTEVRPLEGDTYGSNPVPNAPEKL